jgi:hypothetical protein
MNDRLTVEPGVETQEASKHSGQPAAAPTPRPWARPVFERVRLNEALFGIIYPSHDALTGLS